MDIWPELKRDNYLNLQKYHNNFSKYINVPSVLRWGRGSQVDKKMSFFIPAYKRAETLAETIDSILKQKIVLDYEIIICDNSADLSDDNEIYRFVKILNNPVISLYVNKSNIGMAGNWNRAFEIPKPGLVAMIHDDDLLADDYLENIVSAIEWAAKRGRIGFIRVGFKDYKVSDGLIPIERNSAEIILTEYKKVDALFSGIGPTSCPTCGIVFNRKAVLQVGGFSEQFYPSFDYVLGYQLLMAGYHGYQIEKELGYYRLGLNESINVNVQIGFIMADFFFREYLYSQNWTQKIFGNIFREIQYSYSVIGIAEACRERFASNITEKQLDFRDCCKKYPIRWFLFRAIRKLAFCLKAKYKIKK